jgi:hypothetical protein
MPAPRKYPLELMECGARMATEMRQSTGPVAGRRQRATAHLRSRSAGLFVYLRKCLRAATELSQG